MTTIDHPGSIPGLLDALGIRKRLGRGTFLSPEPFGDGWRFDTRNPDDYCRVLVSPWQERDGLWWVHASISWSNGAMPTYDDLKHLHQAVFQDGYAYQVFAPPNEHINITANVLHLWGRLDGSPGLPDFGRFKTI